MAQTAAFSHSPRGAGQILRLRPRGAAGAGGQAHPRSGLRFGPRRVRAGATRRPDGRSRRRRHDDEQLAVATRAPGLSRKRFRLRQRPLPPGLHRAAGRPRAGAGKLRRDRLQLRDQPVARQARRAERRLRPAQARRRILLLRRLRRPSRAGGRAQRSRPLWRMPRRRALLERLRTAGPAPRLCRSPPHGRPPAGGHRPAAGRVTGNLRFFSATYRLFKLDALEPPARTTVRPSSTRVDSGPRQALRARQAPRHRHRQGVPGLRQHLAHAARHALCAALRVHRQLRHPLRHLRGLRHQPAV